MEIIGSIENLVPLIPLEFYGETLHVCVDTGFNGSLMIPRSKAAELQLDHLFDVEVETASGETMAVESYQAELSWLGSKRTVNILTTEGQFTLLGMKLLEEARLEMEPTVGLLRILGKHRVVDAGGGD